MTTIEERLRGALAEEAEATSVDVLRMRDELTDRLDRRQRRSWVLPSVAASVLVVAALGGVQVLRGEDTPQTVSPSGGVDDEFSCPQTRQVDLSGTQDEFRPDLVGRTPAAVADEYNAPRWEFLEDGDTARLQLGNADGSLGSETRYERRGGEWRIVSSEACGNGSPGTPTSEALRLGVHGSEPWPATDALSIGSPRRSPVLVDDRGVYDYSGLVTRHRTIYIEPCGQAICYAVGQPDSSVVGRLPVFSGRSEGLIGEICSFYLPDDTVGRKSPYRLIAAWDALGSSTRFVVRGEGPGPRGAGGSAYEGVSFGDASWGPQEVWLALVPRTTELSAQLWQGETPARVEAVPDAC